MINTSTAELGIGQKGLFAIGGIGVIFTGEKLELCLADVELDRIGYCEFWYSLLGLISDSFGRSNQTVFAVICHLVLGSDLQCSENCSAFVLRGFSVVGLCGFSLCFKFNSQKISRHIDIWVFGTEDPASLVWGLIFYVPKTLVPRGLPAVGLCYFLLYFKFNIQETSRH